ncbi:MAG: GNAT family N-acetyltransferase [Clostridia bacterium]|nr:GNAT family N-acetyltransferase [Clostridia bacterium]
MALFEVFPVLETDRLRLRQLEEIDAEDLYKIFSSEAVTKYYGMYPVQDIDAVKTMISNFSSGFEEARVIRWGIEVKALHKVVGTCGYHAMNLKHKRAEIGYELSEQHQKMGYMSEALTAAIAFGFEEMNLNRIEGLVYPENTASQHSLMKLGFVKEGLLREYMCFRDQMTDLLMFSLLRREYNQE